MDTKEIWDVIIIGGGPAGLTTGIYTSRQGLKTLLIETHQLGGKVWGSHKIENFPGFPRGITGKDLMKRFIDQAERFGVEIKNETAVELADFEDKKMMMTRAGIYETRTIVIATGIQEKKSSIPGEREYKGRGVSYCGICDGPLFRNKKVAVVGSGKEAVEEAMRLADFADKVYAIPGVEGYKENVNGLKGILENDKIQVIKEAELESICGDDVVKYINLKKGNTDRLYVDGVFLILENVIISDMINEAGIKTADDGCILVDKNQQTNIEGVLAAGDCTCSGMQVITAAGDGAKAGISAIRYLKTPKKFERSPSNRTNDRTRM